MTLRTRRKDAGTIRIEVDDTCIGIKPSQREHMFQPFQRFGAEFTTIEGTGLGLSLVKKLVEAMNGEIDFESE